MLCSMQTLFLPTLIAIICCGSIIQPQKRHTPEASKNFTKLRILKRIRATNQTCKFPNCQNSAGNDSSLKKAISTMGKTILNHIYEYIPSFLRQIAFEKTLQYSNTNRYAKLYEMKYMETENISVDDTDSEQDIRLTADGSVLVDAKYGAFLEGIEDVEDGLKNSSSFDNSSVHVNVSREKEPIIPKCEIGDANCSKCEEISAFCHFMYSEGRCIYYNSSHASKLYECGERWFPMDNNEAFFVTVVILLIATLGIGGYLSLKWCKQEHHVVEDVPEEDFQEMRNIVWHIRQKWLHRNTSGRYETESRESPNEASL